MSEALYTLGPWVTHPDGISGDCGMPDYKIIGPSTGKQVCHVYVDDEQDLANAHLIAAAPDLLEALVSIRAWVTDGGFEDTHEGVAEICGQARAAIAKAKGEQS